MSDARAKATLVAHVRLRRVPPHGTPFTLDAAFEAPPGVTVLFGTSGSGKSTVLAVIAGLTRADFGEVRLGDDVWFDGVKGIDRPAESRRVAMVFQGLALFPHLTALENVAYGIDRSLTRAARRDRAIEMLERMRVPHLAARRPRTFSGGEAQRVALARAFAFAPRLVLLDEPFSALDRDLKWGLCDDVRAAVADLGVPAIVVTHHRGEARALGERAILLERGKVAAVGPVSEIVAGSEDR